MAALLSVPDYHICCYLHGTGANMACVRMDASLCASWLLLRCAYTYHGSQLASQLDSVQRKMFVMFLFLDDSVPTWQNILTGR